jgi:hypothetical protein
MLEPPFPPSPWVHNQLMDETVRSHFLISTYCILYNRRYISVAGPKKKIYFFFGGGDFRAEATSQSGLGTAPDDFLSDPYVQHVKRNIFSNLENKVHFKIT